MNLASIRVAPVSVSLAYKNQEVSLNAEGSSVALVFAEAVNLYSNPNKEAIVSQSSLAGSTLEV